LASPSWIAANISYLRDIDVLESRISSTGKPKDSPKNPEDPLKPKPKKKGKGKGKGDAVATEPQQGA